MPDQIFIAFFFEFKPLGAIFVNHLPIWHLRVNGKVIRTTAEHPFFVWEKGWVACKNLVAGDLLRSHDGQYVAVEEVVETGEEERVYNCSVVDFQTYFVGGEDWGFSVWAHNKCGGTTTGDIGETLAKDALIKRGNTYLGQIQNNSGHGVDLVFRNKAGKLFFVESKASVGASAPGLSYAQGHTSVTFVQSRVQRAIDGAVTGTGVWSHQSASSASLAMAIQTEVKAGNFLTVRANVTNATSSSPLISFLRW